MAITNITDLTEIQASSLTDNDLIAVGTQSGWKKIKANSLGGGGAEELVVEFTVTPGEPFVVTSETTFAQIYSAYQQGKNIRAKATVTGYFDAVFYVSNISSTDVVFFTQIEVEAGDITLWTIRGNSSGYSFYSYQ